MKEKKCEKSNEKGEAFLLGIVIFMWFILFWGIDVKASNNITIAGVDMGYSDGSYFSKNGSACKCHGRGTCGEAADCNCIVVSGTSQCYGWSMWVENKLFGCNEISNSKNFTTVITNYSNCTGSGIYNKLNGKIGAGTHIRTSSSKKGYSHSVSVISYDQNGINITDCNHSGKCQVDIRYYTWDGFADFMNGYGGISFVKACKNSISVPDKPVITNLKSIYTNTNTINLTWSASGGAVSYYIDVWKNESEHVFSADVGNVTSYALNCFGSDGSYKVAVSALNSAGITYGDYRYTNVLYVADIGKNFCANIVFGNSGKLVSSTITGNVEIQTFNGNLNQGWEFQRQDDCSYKIISTNGTGKCLDVHNNGGSGANISIVNDNGEPAQRWYVRESSGYYILTPKCAPDCSMDVVNASQIDGTNVNIYSTNRGAAQQFAIRKASAPSEKPIVSKIEKVYINTNAVRLNWSSIDGATSYYIDVWKGGEHIFSSDIGNVTSYNLNCFGSDGKYEIAVSARNIAGIMYGDYSYTTVLHGVEQENVDAYIIHAELGYEIGPHKGGMATCCKEAVCEICGRTYGVKNLMNHVDGTELRNVKEVSCKESGYTGDIYCKGCGIMLSSGKVVDREAHKWDEGKVTKIETCTEKGVKTYTCVSCKTTKTEDIPVTGHKTRVVKFAKEATCTSEGYTGDMFCQDCGKLIEKGKVIEKLEHTWNTGKITVKATCTSAGTKTFKCSVCGTEKTEEIPATGHGKTEVRNARDTNCYSEGYTGDIFCQDCGKLIEKGKPIEKLDHTWNAGETTVKATCTSAGTKTFKCSNCGAEKTEAIPTTGHGKTEVRNARATSCSSEGYTGDTYCTKCNKRISSGKKIAKKDHSWDGGKITVQPTITSKGTRVFTCKICGTTRTETIAKLEQKRLTPGKAIKDKSTNGVYRVLKDGLSVEFTRPISKKTSIRVPDALKVNEITCKVTEISANAFKNHASLRTVTIGKNVTTIGSNAFYGCKKLSKVSGGNGIVKIGSKAFCNCGSLSSITITGAVRSIGKQAFYNCKKLRTITIKTSMLTSKTIGAKAFAGTYSKPTVRVPVKKLNAYKKLLKSKGMSGKAVYKK